METWGTGHRGGHTCLTTNLLVLLDFGTRVQVVL